MDVALIKDGTVAQVWRGTALVDLQQQAGERDITYDGTLIEMEPGEAVCGMLWNGGVLDLAPPTKESLKSRAREKRTEVINGGCVVMVTGQPVPVWADDGSLIKVQGYLSAAQIGAVTQVDWICRDGSIVTLDAATEVLPLALGMMSFIQAAYATYGDTVLSIEANEIDELQQIEAADWPANS